MFLRNGKTRRSYKTQSKPIGVCIRESAVLRDRSRFGDIEDQQTTPGAYGQQLFYRVHCTWDVEFHYGGAVVMTMRNWHCTLPYARY